MNAFPDGLGDASIIINGKIIDPLEFNLDREFDCDVEIISSPKGLDPITITVVAIAVSLAASYLLAPSIPTQQQAGAVKESPNTSFFGQTNQIRLDEQEPNLYGNAISYPDLIVTEGGSWEYVNGIKIVKELFLIGIGSYQINSEPKFENTPFSDIDGSSYVIYEPNDTVPEVQGQFNAEVVDGQTLLGPNNSDVKTGASGTDNAANYNNTTVTATTITTVVDQNAGFDDLFDVFENSTAVNVNVSYQVYRQDIACDLEAFTDSAIITNMTYNGVDEYTIDMTGQAFTIADCTPTLPTTIEITITELIGASLEVTLPRRTDEIQVSFDFRNGLRNTVQIAVAQPGINPNDPADITYYTYSANTANQLFFTEKLPVVSSTGDLEVTLVRLTDDNADNTDRIQVSQVATNSYRNNVVYGNRTILSTERKATEAALKFSESKVNIDVTRKTISYDADTQKVITTLSASRSFADAVLNEYVEVTGLDSSDLPLDEMYEISDRIVELGYFDYTFSDKEQDLNQKLKIIANVARCVINFNGSEWNLFRNEAGLPVAQFDSRNIASDSPEETSYRGFQEASNDGVRLKWRNPDGNKPDYIYFVIINGVSTQCISQGDGTFSPSLPRFPVEIDLVGCFTESQAIDRADLECRTLIYIQETISTKTLIDGDNVQKGEIVKHVDYWFEDIANGEIKEINGNIYTSHSDIDLDLGSYYVTYTDQFGAVSNPIEATLISSTQFVADLPDAYVANGFTIQCGSRFMISSLDEQNNTLYRVSDKILNSDATVNLELVEYDERIYPEND